MVGLILSRTIRINMMVPVKWSILGIFVLTSVISASGRSALNVGQVVDNVHILFDYDIKNELQGAYYNLMAINSYLALKTSEYITAVTFKITR